MITSDQLYRFLLFRLRYALDGNPMGYWYCYDCDRPTEREESDHGQPAHCARCHSHKIRYVEPQSQTA